MIRLGGAAAALAAVLALVAARAAAEPGTVVLANGTWRPYLGPDLPGGGPIGALVKAAFNRAGWRVTYRYYPWKRGKRLAAEGALDGTIVWSKTAERQKRFRFSAPVIELETVLFYRQRDPVRWREPADLKDVPMAGIVGYDYAFISTQAGYPLRRVADLTTAFRMLVGGRVGAVIEERRVGRRRLDRLGFARVVAGRRPVKRNTFHVMISRAVPDSRALVRAVNEGLAELRAANAVRFYFARLAN